MLIRVRGAGDVPPDEVSDQGLFLRRRQFLRTMAWGAGALVAGTLTAGCPGAEIPTATEGSDLQELQAIRNVALSAREAPTSYKRATTHNNFAEFGGTKTDPARRAHTLVTRPWSLRIEGEVAKPRTVPLEDFLKPHTLEERIYRFRCVEAWSMVIPWVGFPLGDALKRFGPTSQAKYVEFRTLYAPDQMPGERTHFLDWPYREGLRIDEAMHPLTILAVGMYGRVLPNQNGAPLRLVVPWKYGFKSIKSIVGIRLTSAQPRTSWSTAAPYEYGFFANVNPEVDHPRWSQKRERRLGELTRRPTLPFNGYAEQVASLYSGMDLRKYF